MLIEEAQLTYLERKVLYAVRKAYEYGYKAGRNSVKKKCTTKSIPSAGASSKA